MHAKLQEMVRQHKAVIDVGDGGLPSHLRMGGIYSANNWLELQISDDGVRGWVRKSRAKVSHNPVLRELKEMFPSLVVTETGMEIGKLGRFFFAGKKDQDVLREIFSEVDIIT